MSDFVRVMIKWEPPMKLLQVAQGILTCEKQIHKQNQLVFEELFSCRVKVENGSHGYSGIEEGKGIPSTPFNRIKDKLEIMLKSYHDGLALSEYSFFWIQDEYYYTITTLYFRKGIPKTRTVAVVKEEMEAIDIVRGNYGDIHETIYNYCLIEQLQPGLYPNVLKEMWFKWNSTKKEYIGCVKPKQVAHMVSFSIG
jgi:hypothetical protein